MFPPHYKARVLRLQQTGRGDFREEYDKKRSERGKGRLTDPD